MKGYQQLFSLCGYSPNWGYNSTDAVEVFVKSRMDLLVIIKSLPYR
jgi:hypothetical protein